jgi:hypothetical protein
MGHGKNKQKNQKVGLGQQPKETREERRRRIEEEAKAREVRLPRLVATNKDGYVVSSGIVSAVSLFLHFNFAKLCPTHTSSRSHTYVLADI